MFLQSSARRSRWRRTRLLHRASFPPCIVLIAHAALATQACPAQGAERGQSHVGPSSHLTVDEGRADAGNDPDPEAVLRLFVLVLIREDVQAGGGRLFLQHAVGLDAVESDALVRYVHRSMASRARAAEKLVADLCERTDHTVTREDLARELLGIRRQERVELERTVRGIPEVIGTAGSARVLAWVNENLRGAAPSTAPEFDQRTMSADIDPEVVLERACGPTPERQGQGSSGHGPPAN